MVSDLIQVVGLAETTGALIVEGRGYEATVWFDRGDVVHCEMGDVDGRPAFAELLRFKAGKFRLDRDLAPPRRSIDEPLQGLLLDCLRELDEEGARTPTHGDPDDDATLTSRPPRRERAVAGAGRGEDGRRQAASRAPRSAAAVRWAAWRERHPEAAASLVVLVCSLSDGTLEALGKGAGELAPSLGGALGRIAKLTSQLASSEEDGMVRGHRGRSRVARILECCRVLGRDRLRTGRCRRAGCLASPRSAAGAGCYSSRFRRE